MSELVDRESSGHVLIVDMPSTGSHLSSRDADIERDYAEHRAAVLGMLRADFPHLPDPDEIYQEAWAELLALEARGEVVHHRRALLKKIAWRRAVDAAKRRRPDALDPSSPAFAEISDDEPLPDEQAQLRLDADALRVVVESLDEQQAAVLKMRFDQQLSAREVQGRLGISEKRLEAIVTAAYKKIAAQLDPDPTGETRWIRRQRSLLLACELGIASSRQRRRAQAMVDRDPACRAMLRAMRSGLDDVAAVLPVPVLVEEHDRLRGVAGATGRLDELLAGARQLGERLTGRGMPDSSVAEQIGVGGASVGAGAATAKIVAFCLVLGGTTTAVCVDVVDHLHDRPAKAAVPPHRTKPRIVEPDRAHVEVVRLLKTTTTTRSKTKSKKTSHREVPVSSPESTPPASPAPKGSTEFGPGSLGSTSAPKQPAAAPQNGGGEFTP
ncbi:MAG TPA: sigma-70 family RNA polymerase sigma factor [Baekduia sp.]|uniref:sigma-70 family RNA polymerase sigma factor n=1 Tax=Baekduia sp. TaxID=2600305 RepID=UPI002D7872A9|nr:sigma-70 family RNA polymerase sigma factor [Baekduia sp.]HET6507399.1 sigma-70 family RNA polymerase sigma factor [Baekduia sp.]